MKYNGLKQLSEDLGFEVFSKSTLPKAEDIPAIKTDELVELGIQISEMRGVEAMLMTLSNYMTHRLDALDKDLEEIRKSSDSMDAKEYGYCEITGRKKEIGELVTMLDEIVRKITD
jgi:hypothetical protein